MDYKTQITEITNGNNKVRYQVDYEEVISICGYDYKTVWRKFKLYDTLDEARYAINENLIVTRKIVE